MGKNFSRLIRFGTTFAASLLTLSVGLQVIVNANRNDVNRILAVKDTAVVGDIDISDMVYPSDYQNTDDLVSYHEALGKKIQEQGSVLLQSGGALPVKNTNIGLIGARAYDMLYGGKTGSSPKAQQNVTLEEALVQSGFSVDPVLKGYYEDNLVKYNKNIIKTTFSSVKSGVIGKYKVEETACPTLSDTSEGYTGTAIVVVGRQSSEGGSFYLGEQGMADPTEFEKGKNVLGLSINEKSEIEFAIRNYDNVVIMLNTASAMEVPELAGEYAELAESLGTALDVLWVGQPGNYGTLGIASLLKGEVSPSGKLTDTYVANGYSAPANANYGIFNFTDAGDDWSVNKNAWYEICAEGIYVGYKYYETRYADLFSDDSEICEAAGSVAGSTNGDGWNYADEVVYPFGYGLSYGELTQKITDYEVDFKGKASFTVEVKNQSDEPLLDVVQVYVQSPYTDYDKRFGVEKSAIQLLAFEKVEVPADDTVSVTIEADMYDVASYDYVNAGTYIMDYGNYYFAVGNGAHEAINNVLSLQGKTGLTDHNGDPYIAANPAEKAVMAKYSHEGNAEVDNVTYSVSKSGAEVKNQLADLDYNYYADGTVDYLSRSRWNFPVTYDSIEGLGVDNAIMTAGLMNSVYKMKQGEEALVWGAGTGVGFIDIKAKYGEVTEYYSEENKAIWDEVLNNIELEDLLEAVAGGASSFDLLSVDLSTVWEADGPMGICDQPLSARGANTSNPDMPYYIGENDENRGYFLNTLPIQVVISATFSHEIFTETGKMFGNDALWNGVSILIGPGANLHRTPYNARNHEYSSEDPILTSWVVNDICAGAKKYGLICYPKHYAFNFTENNRYGLAEFINEQAAREGELLCFRRAFETENAIGTMTAFNRAGAVFSSAHSGLMTGILRGEWDFKGIAISDLVTQASATYMNVRDSIMAGTDMMYSADTNREPGKPWEYFTEDKVLGDRLMQEKLKETAHHILYVLANSNKLALEEEKISTWYDIMFTVLISAFALLTAAGIAANIYFAIRREGKENE